MKLTFVVLCDQYMIFSSLSSTEEEGVSVSNWVHHPLSYCNYTGKPLSPIKT